MRSQTKRANRLLAGFFVLSTSLMSQLVLANDKAVEAVIEEHWAWSLESYPEMRLGYDDRSGNASWTDMSLASKALRQEALSVFSQQLGAIEPASLSSEVRLNRSMLLREINDERAAYEQGLHLMPINMRSGPQHAHGMAERLPFRSEQDYRDWLIRLRALPDRLQQYQELLTEGMAKNRVQAAIIIQRVPEQIERVVTTTPEASPFYKAFAEISGNIDPAVAKAFQAEAKTVITDQLNPAYRDFGAFIKDSYLPASRPEPGIGSLEGGKAAYRFLVQHFTTTDLSPEAIHQIGLDEVARIRGEMEGVIAEVGFDGELAAFNEFLRTAPQFYYETPEELLEGYQAVAKRLDPELVKLFGKLP